MRAAWFEQGPIRPPSEARSLLLRVTRNCPWNRCLFCRTYKGTRFERRSLEEIREDIATVREIAEGIRRFSWSQGYGGEVTAEVVDLLARRHPEDHCLLNVAMWLHFGARNVFLQDANSLILGTRKLVEILRCIREAFPQVRRITTYARANTAASKSPEDYVRLREAGLSRVHIGLESGCEEVLEFMQKGICPADAIEASRKIRAAGISVCLYVVLGLGGRRRWRQHALETARVLNAANPNYIRFRTLSITPDMPLFERVRLGEFEPMSDEEIVREERLLIERLEGIDSRVVSDHIMNLLEEVDGRLPGDKGRLLGVIDRFLALPPEERQLFQLGRRAGLYRSLDDLRDPVLRPYLQETLARVRRSGRSVEEVCQQLRGQYI